MTKILPKSFEINIRGSKWVKYQHKLLLFYPYRIIKAIFNRFNLRLSQKGDSLCRYILKDKFGSNYRPHTT